MNRCPKCGRALIAFFENEYDKAFLDGIGVECHPSCGYRLTFGALLNHANDVISYTQRHPNCCRSVGLRGHIDRMKQTIKENH